VHLAGDYEPLIPSLQKLKVDQFVLEFATPRAGDFSIVGETLNDREIGLGVVSPRNGEVESVDYIVEKAERALDYYKPDKIYLHPDCGFGTFSGCCVADEKTAAAKMKRIVEAAKVLREKHA